MKVNNTAQTDRIGISALQLKFETMGYSFREQPISDYGIDAHIEVVNSGQATGRLIALQIKSGESWFKEASETYFVYRGNDAHLQYWLNHSLPVIVILYSISEGVGYWQVVTRETVVRTGKGWKIHIPMNQKVDIESSDLFHEIAGVSIKNSEYTILSLRDVSHGNAKRYTANILVEDVLPEVAIESLIILCTKDIANREYYRNDMTRRRWGDTPAHIVSLFVYKSIKDVHGANWICRSQWIDPNLQVQFRPMKWEGKHIGDEVVVDWSSDYLFIKNFHKEQTLSKEDYLDKIQYSISLVRPIVESSIKLTAIFDSGGKTSESYIEEMSILESAINPIYRDAMEIGLPPLECQDVNDRFKNLLVFAHHIFMPFSEKGLTTWAEQNRRIMVRNYIQDYRKEMVRLEFELEKIL